MRAALLCLLLAGCGGSGVPDAGAGGGGSATGGGFAGGTGGGSSGGGSGTGGGSGVGGGSGTGGGGSATGGGGGTTVTVQMLQQQVFTGCFGEGCHSCGLIFSDAGCEWTNRPMALFGSPQMFCDTVVNVMAISSPSKVRVKPNDPDNSFMVQKLEGHLTATEGSPMPPGQMLTTAQVQLLRDWISQGAQPL